MLFLYNSIRSGKIILRVQQMSNMQHGSSSILQSLLINIKSPLAFEMLTKMFTKRIFFRFLFRFFSWTLIFIFSLFPLFPFNKSLTGIFMCMCVTVYTVDKMYKWKWVAAFPMMLLLFVCMCVDATAWEKYECVHTVYIHNWLQFIDTLTFEWLDHIFSLLWANFYFIFGNTKHQKCIQKKGKKWNSSRTIVIHLHMKHGQRQRQLLLGHSMNWRLYGIRSICSNLNSLSTPTNHSFISSIKWISMVSMGNGLEHTHWVCAWAWACVFVWKVNK